MDNTKEFQGWIYYIKNKVNGKMYVGKTNNFERRKMEHLEKKELSCPVLAKAYKKYGIENFIMMPILSFKAINNTVLNQVLNALEKLYIKKHNTYKNGYNLTEGGEGLSGYKHSEKTKEKMRIAAKNKIVTEEARHNYSLAAKRTKNYLVTEKAILQYTLEGIFVKEYKSIVAAHKELTGNPNRTGINVALDNDNQSLGFLWRTKKSSNFPLFIEPYTNPRSKTVYYYTKNNEFIRTFRSPLEASKVTGVPLSYISRSLMYHNCKRRKNYWSYNKIA